MPPYCAPQTSDVASHSVVQPSKIPKPPPGIYRNTVSEAHSPCPGAGNAYGKIKLRISDIPASVGSLNDHLLAGNLRVGEGQLIAGAALDVATGDGAEAVSKVGADGPWGLRGAHVGGTALAAGFGVRI